MILTRGSARRSIWPGSSKSCFLPNNRRKEAFTCLGEHSAHVYGEAFGSDTTRLADLAERGVI